MISDKPSILVGQWVKGENNKIKMFSEISLLVKMLYSAIIIDRAYDHTNTG